MIVDADPPKLALAPPASWLLPAAVLTGTLSEEGCALRYERAGEPVAGFEAEVSGRSVRLRLPYAGVAGRAELTARDPAGNVGAVRLPFRLATDEQTLQAALAEAPAREPIYLAGGEYRLQAGALGTCTSTASLARCGQPSRCPQRPWPWRSGS